MLAHAHVRAYAPAHARPHTCRRAHTRARARVGAGAHTSHANFVLRAIPRSITNARARLDLATRWMLHRRVSALVQHVREPGLPGRWRLAFGITGHGLGVLGGYDVGSRVWSAGVEAGRQRARWVYGVQNHPELGWSHVWMLELGSRRASH